MPRYQPCMAPHALCHWTLPPGLPWDMPYPVSQLFSICPIMQAASGHTPTAGSQTVIMQCLTPKVSYMSYNSLMVLSVSA